MEKINEWVFTICVAAILVTVLGFFIKEEKLFKGIKMVLSLYIILTAISWQGFSGINTEAIEWPQCKAVAPVDTQALIQSGAQARLVKELDAKLMLADIKAECTEVDCDYANNEVKSVTLKCSDDKSAIAAKKLLRTLVGDKAEVKIKAGS